jgi:hypothetical protein
MKTKSICPECLGLVHPSKDSICNEGLKPVLTLDAALNQYLEAIKADYRSEQVLDATEQTAGAIRLSALTPTQERMRKEFEEGLHVVETKLYYRIHTSTSVHSFIVKEDGPKFKRGDILKAASWNTPAKNQARGNIFGTYRVLWTGAEYLR